MSETLKKQAGLTVSLLLAAVVCYATGASMDIMALLVAGAVCELWFWVRAVRRTGGHQEPTPPRGSL